MTAATTTQTRHHVIIVRADGHDYHEWTCYNADAADAYEAEWNEWITTKALPFTVQRRTTTVSI